MRRSSPWLLACVAASALLVGGCADDQPADDPDRIVLRPPAEGADHTHAPGESDPAPIGDGTRADAGGYRLAGLSLPRPTDGPGDLRFRILGPDGLPVTDYTQQQTKLMHLYGEPEQAADGAVLTFHTTFERPGDYLLFVQVRVDGIVHTVPVTAAVE